MTLSKAAKFLLPDQRLLRVAVGLPRGRGPHSARTRSPQLQSELQSTPVRRGPQEYPQYRLAG